MQVRVAEHMGMCFGVRDAITMARALTEQGQVFGGAEQGVARVRGHSARPFCRALPLAPSRSPSQP